ncbi:MAG: reverse transcriptase domain-containing protein, partial [Cetobacterium sp.]
LLTSKLLINSIISTPGARAAAIDLKDFYLISDLPNKEYIRIPLLYIPAEIIEQYNLTDMIEDGHLYAEISKGMYGLPQAGIVAENLLLPRLAAAGYHPTGHTPGLFKHVSNSITFALVVDDFLIKYTDIKDLHHLTDTLKQNYELTMDTKCEKFCGMTITWNFAEGWVEISMPGYVQKALLRFTHPVPKKHEPSPSKYTEPQYGASIQYAEPEDDSNRLDKHGIQ